jgi:hypothetical protein
MTIRELLMEALRENDFDGLCNPDMECGCLISALFPCENPDWEECAGGFKHVRDDGDWIIVTNKEEEIESGS